MQKKRGGEMRGVEKKGPRESLSYKTLLGNNKECSYRNKVLPTLFRCFVGILFKNKIFDMIYHIACSHCTT